jgi:DNA-binding protein YbaB
MVSLQKEIKKYRKSIDEFQEKLEQEEAEEDKDDGLII